MNIKETAQAYEPSETQNISELETVPVNLELKEKTFKEGTPDEFTVLIFEVEGIEYRMPKSVLRALKEHLEEQPTLKYFKVKKQGKDMGTSYTVIPQA